MSDNTGEPTKSKIIPNSYQSPNFLVDEIMRYLTGDEYKCVDVICRKTFGWHKRSDRISKGQLSELTGLSEDAVDKCMAALVKFKVVIRVSESVANKGVEWALQMDDSLIDLQGLIEREEKRKAANQKRTAKAREKRKWGDVRQGGDVPQPPRGDVPQPPQKPIKANILVVIKAEFGEICKAYEQEFGALTPMIADMIKDACDTYPIDWIPEAMQIAVGKNIRSWSYVEGILKRCMAKKIRPSLNKLEKTNGHNHSGNRKRESQTRDPEYTEDDFELAERINAHNASV